MPLFVGHLLMWPLKSGRLHIVLCLLISCYLVVYPSLSLSLKYMCYIYPALPLLLTSAFIGKPQVVISKCLQTPGHAY